MKYTLKNFKIFDAAGTAFEIQPITLLIGGNNAGKSSMAKSLLLLSEFMQQISRDIAAGTMLEWEKYTLNFRSEFHQLGAFDHVLNWDAKAQNISSFEVVYQYQSALLVPEDNELELSLVFVPKKEKSHDYSYEAALSSITILRHGEIVYQSHSEEKDSTIDFTQIKNDYWWYMKQPNPTIKKMVDGKKKLSYRATVFGELGRIFDIRIRRNRWIEQQDNGKTFTISEMSELQRAQYVLPVPPMSLLEASTKEEIDSKIRSIAANISRQNKEYLKKYTQVIFEEFKKSDFQTFGEFYRYYESAFLRTLPIPAGFHNNTERVWLPEYYIIYGTNTLLRNAGIFQKETTSFADTSQFLEKFQWSGENDAVRFAYIHCLLQSWAGVSNYEYDQVPVAVVPELSLALIYGVILLEEFFRTKNVAGQLHYVELNRANIRRIYTLFDPQGTSFNRLVEQFLSSPDTIQYQGTQIYQKGTYINSWISKFSNFDKIIFEDAPEGVGFYAYLKRTGSEQRVSLADVGYGMTPLIALMLHIELVIMEQYKSVYIEANNPVKDTSDIYTIQPFYVYIEEPETNLHPNNQALLAELFVDAWKSYDICFILETHSEYLMRKLQTMVRNNELKSDDVSINNISNGHNRLLTIRENGALDAMFTEGFYDEALELALSLRR